MPSISRRETLLNSFFISVPTQESCQQECFFSTHIRRRRITIGRVANATSRILSSCSPFHLNTPKEMLVILESGFNYDYCG